MNSVTVAVSPLWLLPELIYCTGFVLFVTVMMPEDAPVLGILGLLPLMLFATMLTLCRLFVHGVRFVHAVLRCRRGGLIIEDLIGGPVLAFGWMVFLAVLWIAPLRGSLDEFLWGGVR